MHNNSPFTEEGRTKLRNYQRRVNSYLGLCLVMSLAIGGGLAYYKMKKGFCPLQGLYLRQYAKATVKSFLPLRKPSKFVFLVRVVTDERTGKEVVRGCTDDDVEPLLDSSGRQIYNKNVGPYFKLRPGVEAKYFHWASITRPNNEMYRWMKENIYGGRFLLFLFWPSLIAIGVVFAGGTAYMIALDTRKNREYEEGTLVRGSVLMGVAHFMKRRRRKKEAAGLGIRVHETHL